MPEKLLLFSVINVKYQRITKMFDELDFNILNEVSIDSTRRSIYEISKNDNSTIDKLVPVDFVTLGHRTGT